jgi:NAD(P)H dehydrogenase (quinone)
MSSGFKATPVIVIRHMNVLLVVAHPEPSSYNAYLACMARDTLLKDGHAVRISDLYASDFDPSESGRHYGVRRNPTCFDAQAEQCFNWENRSLPAQVQNEIDKIMWADLLILQFPLWWFGPPAMLKGWMDRVFVYGGLYSSSRRHDRGPCTGKKALICMTTGSSAEACSFDGREGDTHLILWPSLYALRYIGYTVLQPYIIHGVRGGLSGDAAQAKKEYLLRMERDYKDLLLNIHTASTVSFNSDNDWDEHGKLKPEAPVHSPFIRHKRELDLA